MNNFIKKYFKSFKSLKRLKQWFHYSLLLASLTTMASSCGTYEQFRFIAEEFEIPSAVLKADFNQTWQAVIKIMSRYPLTEPNIEAGTIKTRRISNTSELNFTDSFGSSDSIKSAEFVVTINVVKGYRGTQEVTKVTIFKRQFVENDFLQGWKEVPSDGIFEKTFLYRLERMIAIDNKLKKVEELKAKEQEEEIF